MVIALCVVVVVLLLCCVVAAKNASESRHQQAQMAAQLEESRTVNKKMAAHCAQIQAELDQTCAALTKSQNDLARTHTAVEDLRRNLVARNQDEDAAATMLKNHVAQLEQQRNNLDNELAQLTHQRDNVAASLASVRADLASMLEAQTTVYQLAEDGNAVDGFEVEVPVSAQHTLELINNLLASITDSGLRSALLKWVWECVYRPEFQSQLKSWGW